MSGFWYTGSMRVLTITEDEKDLLRNYFQTSSISLIRLKAQAILLRTRGMNLEEISEILFRTVRTVERWIHEFFIKRVASIFSGMVNNEHASKLTRNQKEQIKKELSQPPSEEGIPKQFWDVPKLKEYISATFGVVYESIQSYHYLLKFSNLSFKYPDKRSPHRDEKKIEERIQEVRAEIAPLLTDPEWIVFTSDETRVQLEAEIRRAWLVKGKRTIVKTERSKEHQNYLGFLDQKTGMCQVYEIERGNQKETIRVLKKLLDQYPDKRICVVWDNAKWHKGKLLREQLEKGKRLEKLHLIALPPYAPDHNPIEHVWNYGKEKIKNRGGQLFEEIKQAFLTSVDNHKFSYKI
jgi:transposase